MSRQYEPSVSVEEEPEFAGPDPLLEMAAKARRMVPASRVPDAVRDTLVALRYEVELLRDHESDPKNVERIAWNAALDHVQSRIDRSMPRLACQHRVSLTVDPPVCADCGKVGTYR
jgi:hypothetical protein